MAVLNICSSEKTESIATTITKRANVRGGEPQLRTRAVILPRRAYTVRHPRSTYIACPWLSVEVATPTSEHAQRAEVRLTSGPRKHASHRSRDSPNTKRRFALGASSACRPDISKTCSARHPYPLTAPHSGGNKQTWPVGTARSLHRSVANQPTNLDTEQQANVGGVCQPPLPIPSPIADAKPTPRAHVLPPVVLWMLKSHALTDY